MKKINLMLGRFALVDNSDYEKVSKFKWYADKGSRTYYAKMVGGGKRMHRFILGLRKNSRLEVDHINNDGLDNRRSNLRLCNRSQNLQNARKRLRASSGFKGVCWHKQNKRWFAYIQKNKKFISLGTFKKEKEAALAYNYKSKELFGEFACLNKVV